MRTFETDVLAVGAGPAGLASSALLCMLGVQAIIIAKHPGTAPQPRATHMNQRTVEILRNLGAEERLAKAGQPLKSLGNNVLATSFTGLELFRYASYGTGSRMADYALASPSEQYSVGQHLFEPVLLEAAVERGADIRFSHELVSIKQTAEAVLARVRVRDTDEEYQVRARYAIAADGARSTVAEQLGFTFEGQAALEPSPRYVELDPAGIEELARFPVGLGDLQPKPVPRLVRRSRTPQS